LAWFSKKRAEELAPADPAAILKGRFKEAVHGDFFRTVAYAIPGDPQQEKSEWLEARRADYGPGWQVLRMTRIFIGSADTPLIQQDILSKGQTLTFYDAVESLAKYEATQLSLGYVRREEAQAMFAPHTYVRTFAEEEGIVFDVDGVPHPTRPDGRIPGNGFFPADAYEKARLASERNKTRLPQQPTTIGTPAIGDEMEDGTIYAGISPDTGKAMYATPADAPTTFTFKKAAKYAKKLDAAGHKDWRVPTKNELNVLYQNRAKGKLKGTFNETGSYPAGWYWSSSQAYGDDAWGQRFSDGIQYYVYRYFGSSLRCVR
jgi:Protein of unknown function (DUF1566)